MMTLFRGKKGLTLIEVLIAISLFAIVAVISSNILVDIVRVEKKSSVQNAIYEDLRMILQQLTNEIQHGTIDYEEYYNYYVIQNGGADAYFGINYGVYGSRFYDPGKRLDDVPTYNPTDLGVECSHPNPLPLDEECEVIYTLSLDLNTGQNPFTGVASVSNAFCDNRYGKGNGADCSTTSGETYHLFLIDDAGTKKTLISRKRTGDDDWAIGLVRMEGKDIDQNGIIDSFSCMEEFNCYGDGGANEADLLAGVIKLPMIMDGDDIINHGITVPQKGDLDDVFDINTIDTAQFVPISPLRSDIKDLRFIINPLEDPYKAYAEPSMQSHPSVTIILTIGLSATAEEDYPGDFEDITVQTTVAAGVIGKIDSYPPVNDVKSEGESGWIETLFTDHGIIGDLKTPY